VLEEASCCEESSEAAPCCCCEHAPAKKIAKRAAHHSSAPGVSSRGCGRAFTEAVPAILSKADPTVHATAVDLAMLPNLTPAIVPCEAPNAHESPGALAAPPPPDLIVVFQHFVI
jgi:hypothetical protein